MYKSPIIREFKDFILKGNAISLAVGVIIGAAFAKFVDAVTRGLVQPIINGLGGNPNSPLKLWIFDVGLVINSIISLLITGFILFFMFIRPMNKLLAREVPPPPAEPPPDVKLLAEIRDLLRDRPL